MNAEQKNKLIEQKRLEHSEDIYIDFYGKNCELYDGIECEGWDMESNRCECGNRRVCWVVDGFGKKDEELTIDDVYARAY